MIFYGRCQECKRNRFFLRKGIVTVKGLPPLRPKQEICGKCLRVINRSFKNK